MKLEEKQISLNGKTVNYATGGNGRPILFLHNGGGFWQSWQHQMEYFSMDYQVFGIDWPSFGESDTPEELLSMELLYKTLQSFISKLELENVNLVGNCIGASAAYLYAIRHPENVSKLVLMNICPGELIFPKLIFRKLIPSLNKWPRSKQFAQRILKFAFLNTPIKKKFPPILFGNTYNEQDPLFQKYVAKFKTEKQTKARINLLFSVHTYTFTKYLQTAYRFPHLLVWGKENSVTSYKKHGIHHEKLLKPEQLEIIAEAGHLCMYEKPEEVNQIIQDYLCK